jgi:hypothetical protein
MAKDILRDAEGDVLLSPTGILHGESEYQEVALLLSLNPGDLKHAPLLGPSLIRYVKSAAPQEKIESELSLHFKMDNKDFRKYKKYINTKR